ncbi:MAG: DUF3971 domain-containing protein [Pirellulales bacterium]|nr:DUF3971 domain-containing protein [Pirellulales bacterium]
MHCWFDHCWKLCKTAVFVGAVVALAVGGYLYFGFDEGIRSHIEGLLRKHYTHLDVRVRSARWLRGEGIEVRGITIAEPNGDGERAELVHVEELVLLGIKDLKELIAGPKIDRLILRRMTVRATRGADGTWSTAQLMPLPKFSRNPVRGRIEDGRVILAEAGKQPSDEFELRQIQLELEPQGIDAQHPTGKVLALSGQLVGDHFRRVDIRGQMTPDGREIRGTGTAAGVQVSPDLFAALPLPANEWSDDLAAIQAVADMQFELGKSADPQAPLQFRLTAQFRQGRIEHPRLPYPLADVAADLSIDNQGIVVQELTARNGPTTFWLTARSHGLQPSSPLALELRVRQMVLDERLQQSLAGEWHDSWNKFLPAGVVDADVKLAFDGQVWQPEARVHCRDVAFTYYKFPYRLVRTRGTLDLVGEQLTINLKASSGTQDVRIEGRIHQPGAHFSGKLIVKGEDLQVSDTLLGALVESQRKVIESLNPQGTFDVDFRLNRTLADGPIDKYIWIGLKRCSVRFNDFPYPLDNVRGTVEVNGPVWEFRQLQATNDNGLVTGSGYLRPTAEGSELYLKIDGQNIPLEAELREALSPNVRRIWAEMKPYGSVNLATEVRFQSPARRLSVSCDVTPVGETTSIEPHSFPYRLEKLRGTLHYRDGQVTWDRITGQHDRVNVAAGGRCDMLPGGGWRLSLERLAVDRLQVDDDLAPALPPRLKSAIERLRWNGPLSIRDGQIQFVAGVDNRPLETSWRMAIHTHGGSCEVGLPITNLHGGVLLSGSSTAAGVRCSGELQLDAASFRDVQFTEVRGPIYFDDRAVWLGGWVQSGAPGQTPRRITALVDGGTIAADAQVMLGQWATYVLRASLAGADLAYLSRDVGHRSGDVQGKASAAIELRGSGQGVHTLEGRGSISLSEADIYELPLMVALLKILSVRAPDTSGFSKGQIDFRIQGENVYFDRLDFNGDAITLCGKGQMDLERRVDLRFHALVGRDEIRVPVLREVMGEASQQILQIHVGGTLDAPTTYREPLPGINHVLQALRGGSEKLFR